MKSKILLLVISYWLLLVISPVAAQGLPSPISPQLGQEIQNLGAQAASIPFRLPIDVLKTANPGIYAAGLVQMALSLVGILFIGLVVYGGGLWFMAQGEEEKIKKAKSILVRSVIGLVIILSSYGIAYAIQWELVKATTEQVYVELNDPRLQNACGDLWNQYQNKITAGGNTLECAGGSGWGVKSQCGGAEYKAWQNCVRKN